MAHDIAIGCNGCTACARQCPTNAIRGTPRGHHVIDPDLCIDCGVCGAICPVAAVRDDLGRLVPRVSREARLRPAVDTDACNGCALCIDVCPFGCRAVVGPRYLGAAYLAAPLRCVACGECGRLCLKGAIEMRPMDLRAYDPEAEVERLEQLLTGPTPGAEARRRPARGT